MKNILFSLSLLIVASSFVFSQSKGVESRFKVVWGTPYEIPKKFEDNGYFGNIKDGIVQISMRQGKELVIQRFDPAKLSLTKQDNIDITKIPSGFIADLFTMLNGKLYLFYSIWDKPRKKEQLFVQQIDVVKGNFSGEPKMLIEADKIAGELISTGFYKFEMANKYKISFSNDSSKILVTYRKYPEEKRDALNKDIIGFFVFDSEFNKLWGNEFKMPYTEKMMDNTDYCIDSKGNAYTLCKVYEGGDKKEEKNSAPNYHFEVFKIEEGFSDIKQLKIKLDNKFINNLSISEDLKGKMICAGYYRKEYKSTSTDGAFIVRIGDTDEISNVNKGYFEFPSETLKEFEKSRTQDKIDKADKKSDAEVPNLELRKIVLNTDGSILLIGEQFLLKIITHTTSNGQSTSTTTTYKYYYSDIYTMKIDPLGDIDWVRKIPKNQYGSLGRGGMSFSNFNIDGDSYFLYLDNIKNLNLTPDKAPAQHVDGAGGFLTVCKIDSEGNVTKGKLFDIREKDVKIWPAEFSSLTSTVFLGRSYSDKQSKMMKITLK